MGGAIIKHARQPVTSRARSCKLLHFASYVGWRLVISAPREGEIWIQIQHVATCKKYLESYQMYIKTRQISCQRPSRKWLFRVFFLAKDISGS